MSSALVDFGSPVQNPNTSTEGQPPCSPFGVGHPFTLSQSSMVFSTDGGSRNCDEDGGFRGFKAASGSSRPRLVKVRRHLGSQSKPATPVTAGRVDPGFNPFRPVAGFNDSGDQAGVPKMWDAKSKKDSNFNRFGPVASVSDCSDRTDEVKMRFMEGEADSGFDMFRPRAPVSSDDGKVQGTESGINLGPNEFRTSGSVSDGSDRGDAHGMQSTESWVDLNFNLHQPKAPVSDGSESSDRMNNVRMQATKEWADNLFKPAALFSDGSDQADDRKMHPTECWPESGMELPRPSAPVLSGPNDKTQTLRDQFYSWNPFTSQKVKDLDGSGGANVESFGFQKSNDSGFKFGADPLANSSYWGSRLPAEMGKLKIGNEMASSDINSSGFIFSAGSKGSSSSSLDSNANLGEVPIKADAFVFGSSVKKSIGSGMQFPGETMVSGLPDEMTKSKVEDKPRDANNSTMVKENVHFVFGNSENVAGAFGETMDAILPNEMKKLNIRTGTGMGDGKVSGLPYELRKLKIEEKAEVDDHRSKIDHKFHFVFKSNKNVSSSSSRKMDAGGTDAGHSTASTSVQDENKVPGTQDGRRRLKIERKTKHANLSSKLDEKIGFVFGSNKNVSSSSSQKTDIGGTGAGHSTASMSVQDENMVSKIHDEKRKLKTEGKTKDANLSSKMDENIGFVFGCNKNDSDNVDFVFGSIKNVPRSFRGSMGTGGNVMSCSTSTITAENENGASGLSDEVQKLRIEENAQDTTLRSKSDEKTGFVFGINNNISDKSGGNSTNHSSFPTSMEDAYFRNSGFGIFTGSTSGCASVPESFSFQPGIQHNSLGMGQIPSTELKGDPSLLSSTGSFYQSAEKRSSANQADKKPEFYYTSPQQLLKTPQLDLRTNQNADGSMDSLFAGLDQNLEFSGKRGTVKSVGSKKKRGKMKPTRQGGIHFISSERSSQENPEVGSPGSYSPMDFSPYHEEISSADQHSRETSVASDQSLPFATNHESMSKKESGYVDAKDEDLLDATQYPNTDENDTESGELNSEGSKHNVDGYSGLNCLSSEKENATISNNVNIEMPAKGRGSVFCFSSRSHDPSETNFTFAATQPTQGSLSAVKRLYRKKNKGKVAAPDSYPSTPEAKVGLASPSSKFFSLASSLQPGPNESQNGVVAVPQNEADKEQEIRQESVATIAATTAAQEACEKWRLRGNQAYASGNLSKAEECYTRGVSCISPKETTRSCIRALMLCYSNRAATRMSLGRMREALGDCMMAASLDPNFMRVQIRAANCYLALGDIKEALKHFKKCLQAGEEASLDQKIITEASDGLQKAKQVAEFMDSSAELLRQRTSKDAANALQSIVKALSMSSYSDELLEMKAEALLLLRKHEEVVQLCEQTMEPAETNSALSSDDGKLKTVDVSANVNNSSGRLWRWRLMSKSYFYMGRLEEALDLLQKHEKVGPLIEKFGSRMPESSVAFAVTVQELLHHKAAGNEAFQAGRHSEAVEHYTAAIACSVESRPFAAICFCNRAAAYQALGQIADAIADCSLAIALDSSYPKAISRRATLHEMIRDYGQALNDLHRLISLLEKQIEDKANQAGTSGRSNTGVNDLRQARIRLAMVEEEAKKEIQLDMYLILGIEPSSTASDIKKAYRKAALRHHPDKAGQFLARTENGDDSVWKEVAEEVYRDADRLFKMIGEAYAVISDPNKRKRYDADEETRNAQKKGNGNGTPRSPQDAYDYPFEQGGIRRRWQDTWKSYGSAQKRWSEMSRSHRYS